MIPPTASLVKYDNPVLVSRNTEKKSPRVRLGSYAFYFLFTCEIPWSDFKNFESV